MKLFSLFSMLFCLPIFLLANTEPEPIFELYRKNMSAEYYAEQAELWKAQVAENQEDANAWYNYYRAVRYAKMKGAAGDYNPDQIAKDLQKNVPNSFESHYLAFVLDSTENRWELLRKACEIDPNRPEPPQVWALYHELNGDKKAQRKELQKWYDMGLVSPNILKWNYNLLNSVKSDAILFTNGDMDTYPVWMLQQLRDVQPDVLCLNLHLFGYPEYMKRKMEAAGVPPFDATGIDQNDRKAFQQAIVNHIIKYTKRPVYLAVTTWSEAREHLKEQLFLTGLAFKYSTFPFDNIGALRENYERKFLLDYLKIDLWNDPNETVVNEMSQNYLPAFLSLHRYYEEQKNVNRTLEIEEFAKQVASNGSSKQQAKVARLFVDKQTKMPTLLVGTNIDLRAVDKTMKQVNNLYVSDHEVSNLEYNTFLKDLLEAREFDKLEICKPNSSNWDLLIPVGYKYLDRAIVFENGHPDKADYLPIQNISHEAAQLYCDWLTETYNRTEFKKKSFQEVKFRLPTEDEWESAARGGHQDAPYPWGGYYFRNAKGCFLSNFEVSSEDECDDCTEYTKRRGDGGVFTVKVDAYFPNDYGLYGMSGNVAEMVSEKGVAKGGSWDDKGGDCTVVSRRKYADKDARVGFRVFMEVIK